MAYYFFDFPGGDQLQEIGASWFVSYIYHERIDKKHTNWNRVSTVPYRSSIYKNSRKFHREWLQQVVRMSPDGLGTNTIGLTGFQVKDMAREVLKWWDSDSLPDRFIKPIEKIPAEIPKEQAEENTSEQQNTTEGWSLLVAIVICAFVFGVVCGKCFF